MSVDGEEKGKIVDRLRQALSSRAQANSTPPFPAADPASDFDREDLEILQRGADIYHVSLDSTHQLGKPLTFARRVWRKILKPLFLRQVHYNSANARLLAAMQARIEQLEADKKALHVQVRGRIAQPLGETVDRLGGYEAALQELRDEIQTQRAQMQERIDDLKSTEKQQSRAIVKLHKQVKRLKAEAELKELSDDRE